MLRAKPVGGRLAFQEFRKYFQKSGMIAQIAQLRILDEMTVSRELDLVSELFHRINRVIPESQHLLTIPPETTVREAVTRDAAA